MASTITSSNPLIQAAEARTQSYVPRILRELDANAMFGATDIVLRPTDGAPSGRDRGSPDHRSRN